MKNIEIAGVDLRISKLADAKDHINSSVIASIIKHGKMTDSIYHRVRGNVVVLVCGSNVPFPDIGIAINIIKQKVSDQKKAKIKDGYLYQFGNNKTQRCIPILTDVVA